MRHSRRPARTPGFFTLSEIVTDVDHHWLRHFRMLIDYDAGEYRSSERTRRLRFATSPACQSDDNDVRQMRLNTFTTGGNNVIRRPASASRQRSHGLYADYRTAPRIRRVRAVKACGRGQIANGILECGLFAAEWKSDGDKSGQLPISAPLGNSIARLRPACADEPVTAQNCRRPDIGINRVS